ncbi:MAG: PUR family DNA/RNA-binding protein [Bacteroidales bacterium]|jgi:hypothetical protein|nr:PUR family DNA/RNA-binding protein [Bacteroidales bacterium]
MENKERTEFLEVYSTSVKAGKRTYFFDVKQMESGEKFMIITESKRKFNDEDGTFTYQKHKIYLYKEDNEKFLRALSDTIKFIETGIEPEKRPDQIEAKEKSVFDDLDFKLD